MFSKLLNNSAGYSLVETMSAVVILTIAIFPALGYFANSVGFVHQTEIRSQAMDIASDTMENFKSESKNNWSNLNSEADSYTINNLADKYDFFVDDYNIEVKVSATELIEDVKDIKVTISWNDGANNLSLSSLLRDGG